MRVEGWISISGAVQQKVVGVGPVASDTQGRVLLWPPVERVRAARLRTRALVNGGREQRQRQQVSAVQRELLRQSRLDHLAQAGVRRAQVLCRSDHLNVMRYLSQGRYDVEPKRLINFERQLPDFRGKAGSFHSQLILSRIQARELIRTGSGCLRGAGESGPNFGQHHLDPG